MERQIIMFTITVTAFTLVIIGIMAVSVLMTLGEI